MDINPLLPDLYRQRLREYLADMERRRPPDSAELLFADLLLSRPRSTAFPPAPQGIGESGHSAVDEKHIDRFEKSADLGPIDTRDDRWAADSAVRYELAAAVIPSPEARKNMEADVRRCKKSGRPCPYAREGGACDAPFIRCGDRRQYSTRETPQQRSMAHACLYVPGSRGAQILVVDDDPSTREFCRNSLEIFLNLGSDRVATAGSAAKAVEIVNSGKIEGRRCGVCIIDADLPGMSGFELVNELFNRNHNVEILLLQRDSPGLRKPADYMGDQEVLPYQPLVRKTLTKPFHSQDLIEAVKSLGVSSPGTP